MSPRDRPGDIATTLSVSSCDDSSLRRSVTAPWFGLTHRPGARLGTRLPAAEGQPRRGAPRAASRRHPTPGAAGTIFDPTVDDRPETV